MSVNLPQSSDLVKFEMRMVQGQDPYQREQKRPGGFSRFLSGIGKVLGAVTMPLSFIFPPMALASAGMYGMGAMGDLGQARAAQKQAQKQANEQNTMVSFPGLEIGGSASALAPAAFDMSAREQSVMNVLDARGGTMQAMTHQI